MTGRRRSPRHVSEDLDAHWAAQYRSGMTMDEIAAAAGYSLSAVRNSLVDSGVTLRRPGPTVGRPVSRTSRQNVSPELREGWAKQYRDGMSIRHIATASGYSYGAIHNALRATGVTLRRPGAARHPRGGS